MQRGDGMFSITLSALGQQYVATTSNLVQESQSTADAVLILDVTGSMEQNRLEDGKKRSEAMV